MFKALSAILMSLLLTTTPVWADLDDEEATRERPKPGQPTTAPDIKKTEPDLGTSDKGPARDLGAPPTPAQPSGSVNPAPLKNQKSPPPSPTAKPETKNPLRPRQGEGHNNTLPINWKAKGFKGTRAGRLIELKQDVEVNQDKMKLSADRADIYFDESDALTKVHANGNVKIRKDAVLPQDQIFARGNEAVFYNAERKVVLKGKAMLTRGQDVVRGRQISYDLDTGWITVDSVEGVVQPGEAKKP